MPKKTTKYVPHCELCQRVMNSSVDLTDMWKPGTNTPLYVCSSGKCWDEANSRGYFSKFQKDAAANSQRSPAST